MTLFQIGIRKRYTIPCYKITSAGSSACPMVLTLEVFGRDASELLERFYKPCCESCESIMNSRPITTVSSDPNDNEPLTPNHLLLLKSEVNLPLGLFKREDSLLRRRWKQVQYLADIFWKRWSREYLPLLQLRQKWVHPKRNLTVGDIVLVASGSHHNSWPLGRVVETFPDKGGLVRRVKVLTKTAVYKRPVDKLCVLVENESPSTGNVDTKN